MGFYGYRLGCRPPLVLIHFLLFHEIWGPTHFFNELNLKMTWANFQFFPQCETLFTFLPKCKTSLVLSSNKSPIPSLSEVKMHVQVILPCTKCDLAKVQHFNPSIFSSIFTCFATGHLVDTYQGQVRKQIQVLACLYHEQLAC